MGGTAEGPRPPGRVLNRVFLGILWTHLGLCGLLLPASPDIWEAVRPLRDAGPRSALLRGPLCEAHCRDFHRAPVQPRDDAHLQPLQKLQLLLGVCGTHCVLPEPPPVPVSTPATGPRCAG